MVSGAVRLSNSEGIRQRRRCSQKLAERCATIVNAVQYGSGGAPLDLDASIQNHGWGQDDAVLADDVGLRGVAGVVHGEFDFEAFAEFDVTKISLAQGAVVAEEVEPVLLHRRIDDG